MLKRSVVWVVYAGRDKDKFIHSKVIKTTTLFVPYIVLTWYKKIYYKIGRVQAAHDNY